MPDASSILTTALSIFERLVAFDTTSRLSNLALVEHVEGLLAPLGVTGERVPNAEGTKANYYATIGPAEPGGVILSGHSDVVPVDGQPWSSDPFRLTERTTQGERRLYGRGTCDMKGFIALALAAAPHFARGRLPVHLAISYDEEVGCQGAPAMIARIAERLPAPRAAIIGEPSMMQVVSGHKGIIVHEVEVTGHEAHSSLTHLGLSANMVAIRLMAKLTEIAEALAAEADPASPFTPPHATLTVGEMAGGTAVNILARKARFAFDLRAPGGVDTAAALAPFHALVEELDADMRARFPGTGIAVTRIADTPPLAPEDDGAAEALARALTGDNSPARAVSFAAEAGQFQRAGFSACICGPGSIEQAHQPDEYIAVSQMEAGAAFMARLAEQLG